MTSPELVAISGAAGALGSAVADVLERAGTRLLLLDSDAHAARLHERAARLGDRAVVVTGDVAEHATWARATAEAKRVFGRAPDGAALVAGGWAGGEALHAHADDARLASMLRKNVDTAYAAFRALLPPMVEARRGSVVVVGSRAAVAPETSPTAAEYAASKAALVALAQATAESVREHGVRINAILPSTMDTPANRASMPNVDPARWVSLPSAAAVVAFLLGEGSVDVSGAALPVYGRS